MIRYDENLVNEVVRFSEWVLEADLEALALSERLHDLLDAAYRQGREDEARNSR